MLKLKNKKGFTLAELLIVVAIIAVLTAIAVPLFVNAINNANEKAQAADIRAVRAAAVVEILSDTSFAKYGAKDNTTGWTVDCNVDKNGNMGTITIKTAAASPDGYTESGTATDDGSGGYNVKILIKKLTYSGT